MPSATVSSVRSLIKMQQDRARVLTQRMLDSRITVNEWQSGMQTIIKHTTLATAMMGSGTWTLSQASISRAESAIVQQYAFLANFAQSMARTPMSDAAGNTVARAAMYPRSAIATYWKERTIRTIGMITLPAYPADGTAVCLTNCRCQWQITMLRPTKLENGVQLVNANAVWKRHPLDNCPTCRERARLWRPLRIRNGAIEGQAAPQLPLSDPSSLSSLDNILAGIAAGAAVTSAVGTEAGFALTGQSL